ncbi:MAG: pilus assembly protein [Elusimicrobiaceae bacterium]|nr:pilus assembly protein [Elusimicrobiaceae bacterium]MBT4439952.1 pilus assembly protein [Elusimicrobiaceae bacterium]
MKNCKGQSAIELLLVLPIFMLLIFFILELGNIAYHTILANHTSYELARIGSMVAVREHGGKADSYVAEYRMKNALEKMFKRDARYMSVSAVIQPTGKDPQTKGHVNEDLIVTLVYPIRLIFPGTKYVFADKPKKLGKKRVKAVVRMPIEKPLLN